MTDGEDNGSGWEAEEHVKNTLHRYNPQTSPAKINLLLVGVELDRAGSTALHELQQYAGDECSQVVELRASGGDNGLERLFNRIVAVLAYRQRHLNLHVRPDPQPIPIQRQIQQVPILVQPTVQPVPPKSDVSCCWVQ